MIKWTKKISTMPDPGIYLDVPFDVYQSWPYLNKSSLSDYAVSPAQCHARMTGQLSRTISSGFLIGSMTNSLWVEQESLDQAGYVVMPKGMQRRGKAYEELVASLQPGQQLAPWPAANKARQMAARLEANAKAMEIRKGALAEVSLVWDHPVSKIRLKGRVDLLNEELLIEADLKSARDITRDGFAKAAADYNYHWQHYYYCSALKVLTGKDYSPWWIVVKNDEPYDVAVWPMAQRAMELAEREISSLVMQFRGSLVANQWPEKEIDLPHWRYKSEAM